MAKKGLKWRLEEVKGEQTGWVMMELSKGGGVDDKISGLMLRLHGMEYDVKFDFIEMYHLSN